MTFLRRLFRLPEFLDEQEQLTADWLLITLLSLVIIFWMLVANAILQPTNQRFFFSVASLLGSSIAFSYFLLKQKQAPQASLILVAFLLATATYVTFLNAGELRPGIVIYNVIILISGLLLGSRGAIGASLFLALQSTAIILAKENGWLVALTTPFTANLNIFTLSVGYLLNGIIFALAVSTINNLLRKLRIELTQKQQVEQNLRESLQEKEVLLKEVHHRVKNNMQVIVSLLRLQAAHLNDPLSLQVLRESQNRVYTMALIHEKLYQSQNLAQLDLGDYLQHLTSSLFHTYSPHVSLVDLQIEVESVQLQVDQAIPCGLIVNELVSNALKHAFPKPQKGNGVRVTLNIRTTGLLELAVADNGVGFPVAKDWQHTETLGMQLVQSLVKQIKGTIELTRQNPGTQFTISFAHSK
jgi:two-component sensor histidine kinase